MFFLYIFLVLVNNNYAVKHGFYQPVHAIVSAPAFISIVHSITKIISSNPAYFSDVIQYIFTLT